MKEHNIKQTPFLGLEGSGGGLASRLAVSGASPKYLDDVFSTYLFDGNSSSQTITNGIDLSGEGGLIWIKRRDNTDSHRLFDTERTVFDKYLDTSSTNAETFIGNFGSPNNNGFTMSASATGWNETGGEYTSWTFRKCPGFLDIVTYTGNSVNSRTINHNLGSEPGMVIIKRLDSTSDWPVYHIAEKNVREGALNTSYDFTWNAGTWFDHNGMTSTTIQVKNQAETNTTGGTYVAYIFAHDDQSFGQDSNQSAIKCGSYTGNGSATGPVINLGFEPQWVILKPSSGSGQWQVYDTMRGWTDGGKDKILYANLSAVEDNTNTDLIKPFSTGFQLTANYTGNDSGVTYIYMAIRRPNKPPTAATEVFKPVVQTSQGTVSAGFPVDMVLFGDNSTSWGYNWTIQNRLTGGNRALITSNVTNPEFSSSNSEFDSNTGFKDGWVSGGTSGIYQNFRRAPGFYDTVAYTGDSTANQQIPHNLEVAPELIITKIRNSYGRNWAVYSSVTGAGKWLQLNDVNAVQTGSGKFDTAPTSTIFYVSADSSFMTGSGGNYVAHLFATLPGISKVGSYTGTGSALNVDCGFTAGARFVMIKRTDPSGGGWYVWDSARGIVSGNDPYFLLNDGATSVTSTDYIDPLNAGFTVTSSAPDVLNASGGSYIFLAIA